MKRERLRITRPGAEIHITPAHDMNEAACMGLWELFDSTDLFDHIAARRLCDMCPAFRECMALLADVKSPELEGTWAGQLYQRRRRASKEAA